MSPALASFVFEAANFLLLAAVLGWLLFAPVRRALDAERARHDAERAQAEHLHAQAAAEVDEARKARDEGERALEERRKEIVGAAEAQARALLDEARRIQRSEREALTQELETMRLAEAQALAETVGRAAADAVRRLLGALPGPSLDLSLVRAACAELRAIPVEAREQAVIESARPLDDEARGMLGSVLGARLTWRVVPALGAGVRVTTAGGQIDATAISLARQAAQVVRQLGAAQPAGEASHG